MWVSRGKKENWIKDLEMEKGKGCLKGPNEYFNNAIQKYGWDKGFEHIVLFKK